MSYLEKTVSSCTFGVDNSFWDSFTVEVSDFVDQLNVLEEDRTAGTCCQ